MSGNTVRNAVTEFNQREWKRLIVRGEILALNWPLKEKKIFHWREGRAIQAEVNT